MPPRSRMLEDIADIPERDSRTGGWVRLTQHGLGSPKLSTAELLGEHHKAVHWVSAGGLLRRQTPGGRVKTLFARVAATTPSDEARSGAGRDAHRCWVSNCLVCLAGPAVNQIGLLIICAASHRQQFTAESRG